MSVLYLDEFDRYTDTIRSKAAARAVNRLSAMRRQRTCGQFVCPRCFTELHRLDMLRWHYKREHILPRR